METFNKWPFFRKLRCLQKSEQNHEEIKTLGNHQCQVLINVITVLLIIDEDKQFNWIEVLKKCKGMERCGHMPYFKERLQIGM